MKTKFVLLVALFWAFNTMGVAHATLTKQAVKPKFIGAPVLSGDKIYVTKTA